MKPNSTLRGRPGLTETTEDPLTKRLGSIAREYGVLGFVFLDFTRSRVGVRSGAGDRHFAKHMEMLGDRLLAAIDDGQFDPEGMPE